jgi:predicted TIM-barrel fold metal-dependent hydrolase
MTDKPLDAMRVVSADSHLNPPPDIWAEYLAPEFRDRAPVIESTDEGDFQIFEGKRRPMVGLTAAAGRKPEEYTLTVRRFTDVRAGGWSPGPRIEDMDIDGVDAEVLYGTLGDPLQSSDPRLTRASYTAYNDWLADFCAFSPNRLIGIAYIPCNDVDDAIAEIRHAAGKGLRGAMIPHVPPDGTTWGDDKWLPLWQTLVEIDWPASFHVGGSSLAGSGDYKSTAGYFNSMVATKLQMPLTLGAIVMSGLLERLPELKLVSVEGQIGWIPFWKYYLDHAYQKHRWHKDLHFAEVPSFYIERQCFYTFMEDPPGIEARHACGVDRIMWSSDYPHSETTWPNSHKIIDETMAGVPEAELTRIVRDNCVELYHLG